MVTSHRVPVALLLGYLVCFAGSAAFARGITEIVAMLGDPAPDGNGVYSSFGSPRLLIGPTLNAAGEVVFWAELSDTSGFFDKSGIFSGGSRPLTQIVRTGEFPPDGNGRFAILSDPALNDLGETAYWSQLFSTNGGTTDNRGIFRRAADGTPTQIVREGQPAPDGNGTIDWLRSSPNIFTLNQAGEAAFLARLAGTSGGESDNGGLFRGSGGPLTQIVRLGDTAPDGNGTISDIYYVASALNDSGEVAFQAEITDNKGGENWGIFRGAGGPLTEIARLGDAAPDGNGTFFFFRLPHLDDSGEVTFRAELTGTSGGENWGIFRSSGGPLTQIARVGQTAPDGTGTFSSLGSPALNASGDAVFGASLTGTSGGSNDDSGLFKIVGGQLTQFARAGEFEPDGNGTFSALSAIALNASGDVAFWATLNGTSGVDADRGIFFTDGIDTHQVALLGAPLAGSTISGFVMNSGRSPGSWGSTRSGFNDVGQVAYRFRLVDGREGIALWTPIPEPASFVLLGMALPLLFRFRCPRYAD